MEEHDKMFDTVSRMMAGKPASELVSDILDALGFDFSSETGEIFPVVDGSIDYVEEDKDANNLLQQG